MKLLSFIIIIHTATNITKDTKQVTLKDIHILQKLYQFLIIVILNYSS